MPTALPLVGPHPNPTPPDPTALPLELFVDAERGYGAAATGGTEAPFSSLGDAVAAVRRHTVTIAGGVYGKSANHFRLTDADSGCPGAPVVYRAVRCAGGFPAGGRARGGPRTPLRLQQGRHHAKRADDLEGRSRGAGGRPISGTDDPTGGKPVDPTPRGGKQARYVAFIPREMASTRDTFAFLKKKFKKIDEKFLPFP